MDDELTHDELLRHLRGFQRIVINTCHGGFSLSKPASILYLERAGIPYSLVPQADRDTQNRLGDKIVVNGQEWYERDMPRDDPILVDIVRQLGSKANGEYAKLKVVEVPPGVKWFIQEYDGREWVAEQHRTWH